MADKHEQVAVTDNEPAQTDERCPFPNQLSNDARAIARIDNKSFCQINQEALAWTLVVGTKLVKEGMEIISN